VTYDTLKVRPLTRHVGAEVEGIDLGKPMDEATWQEFRSALHEHLVLFCRDQHLQPEDHTALARRFGFMEVHEVFTPLEGFPHISVLEHDRERPPVSNVWHSDVTFRPEPSMFSILHARVIPPFGGDTLWLSAYAALEGLSEPLRQFVSGLTAVHDFIHAYGGYYLAQADGTARYRRAQDENPPTEHPVVVTHPVTQRQLLYVNPTFTSRIVELNRRESRALLDLLFAHLQTPEYHVRFTWRENDVAIWDNRATQHYATADYFPHHRRMHRITVGGTRPTGPH